MKGRPTHVPSMCRPAAAAWSSSTAGVRSETLQYCCAQAACPGAVRVGLSERYWGEALTERRGAKGRPGGRTGG